MSAVDAFAKFLSTNYPLLSNRTSGDRTLVNQLRQAFLAGCAAAEKQYSKDK